MILAWLFFDIVNFRFVNNSNYLLWLGTWHLQLKTWHQTLTMEIIFQIFPLLGEKISNNIDDESLVKLKESSQESSKLLEQERFFWIRIIKHYKDMTLILKYKMLKITYTDKASLLKGTNRNDFLSYLLKSKYTFSVLYIINLQYIALLYGKYLVHVLSKVISQGRLKDKLSLLKRDLFKVWKYFFCFLNYKYIKNVPNHGKSQIEFFSKKLFWQWNTPEINRGIDNILQRTSVYICKVWIILLQKPHECVNFCWHQTTKWTRAKNKCTISKLFLSQFSTSMYGGY